MATKATPAASTEVTDEVKASDATVTTVSDDNTSTEAPAPAVSISPWQAAETKVKAILAMKDQDAQLKAVEKTAYNEVSLLVSMIVVPGIRKPLEDKHDQALALW
jgi:hypothetical protein